MKRIFEKYKYYFIYTIVFILISLLIYYPFYSSGKSLIYNGDGYSQHYKALIYYSDYLKKIFHNLFFEHKLLIPQWDFSIGEGADILGTFHYYVIGDPIAFLSVFVPKEKIYIFYNLSVVFRIYLSGLLFSYLCMYKGIKNKYAILGGSIAYAYCFWSIFNANRHIYFINPMVYFPLIIIGIEKIINNEKPYLLTFSVMISCLSNFYFFYNIVLLTVIYVAFRLIILYGKNLKEIGRKLLTIFKYSLLGVLLSSVILLPMIKVFLNDGRVNSSYNLRLYYPLSFYLKLVSSFFSTTRQYWLCMGYSAPILFGILSIFKNWKKNLFLSILNVLAIIFVLCPIFGQVFNGFGYISNKWCFAISLLFAYDLVQQWDELDNNRIINILIISLIAIALAVLGGLHKNVIIPLTIALLFTLSCFTKKKKELLKVSFVIIGVLFIAFYEYTSFGNNYINDSTTYKEDKNVFNTSEAQVISNLQDSDFFRYSGNDLTQNAALIFEENATDYYWSLTNPNVSEYRTDMELSEYSLYKFYEYDQRSPLYSLANVKYYVTNKDSKLDIPQWFEYYKQDGQYKLYKNTMYLPFGYTYTKALSYDDWDKYNTVQKEEAMLQAVFLDDGNDEVELNSKIIDYQVTNYEGIEIIDKNNFKVNEQGATLTLKYDENYRDLFCEFKNISYDDGNSWLSGKNDHVDIFVSNGDVEKTFEYGTNDNRYYNGRKDFCVYLNNCEKDYLTIRFIDKGTYKFDDINLISTSTNDYAKYINCLKENTLIDVKIETNVIKGKINADDYKYLLLSVPYSDGWSAYVNGENVKLLRANKTYSALYLQPGENVIELKYETPLLKEGLIITLISTLLIIVDIVYYDKISKKYRKRS